MNEFSIQPGTVYFIGAGPGAPDLISVRGASILAAADLILYADSLVEASILRWSRNPQVRIERSSGLHLEQILALMVETAQRGGVVARVHSGDPALYGAIHEQMAHLDDLAIPYEIVPGITAAFAAAARLKCELTIPDVVQTVIFTRTAGRTAMPPHEDLRHLAASRASLAIYLSVTRMGQVVADLRAGGYPAETPVAVLHRVTWPDESYVVGTLADITEKVRAAGYTRQALILVSPALDPALKSREGRTTSHLYDKTYTHRFRRAVSTPARPKPNGQDASAPTSAPEAGRSSGAVLAVTRAGSQLALRLAQALEAELVVPARVAPPAPGPDIPLTGYTGSVLDEVRRRWSTCRQLVLVMPTGVAVRAIAPLLADKRTDPAVVCLDEAGRSVIPLVGGHRGGANGLARRLAALTGGHAAITTASDLQGKPALDLLGLEEGWRLEGEEALTPVSAALVNGAPIGLFVEPALADATAPVLAPLRGLGQVQSVASLAQLEEGLAGQRLAAAVIVSHRRLEPAARLWQGRVVVYRPPLLVAGIGCRRGVDVAELQEALEAACADAGLALSAVGALATASIKQEEPGLHALAARLQVPLVVVPEGDLAGLAPEDFSPSAAQEKFGLPGVAEPCARLVAGGPLLVPKQRYGRCTVAIALRNSPPSP